MKAEIRLYVHRLDFVEKGITTESQHSGFGWKIFPYADTAEDVGTNLFRIHTTQYYGSYEAALVAAQRTAEQLHLDIVKEDSIPSGVDTLVASSS